MTGLGSLRVLLIDGSTTTRGDISARLGARGWTVLADAGDASLPSLIEVFEPELVIADVTDRDPGSVVRHMRACRDVPVIVTIPRAADPHVRTEALVAGASDALVRPFEIDELLARIDLVLRHHGTRSALAFDGVSVDETAHIVQRDGVELELTVTEFKLLSAFLRNPGRVMSKRQLLGAVWGFDDYDVNLVEVHVSALRRKMELHGPRIIQTVRGIGYVLRGDRRNGTHAPRPKRSDVLTLF